MSGRKKATARTAISRGCHANCHFSGGLISSSGGELKLYLNWKIKHLLGLLQFIKSKIYRYSSHTTSLTRLGLHPLNSLDPHMPKTLCIPETLIPHPKPPHPDRVLYRILVTFLWTTAATPGFPRGGADPRETTNQLFGITFAKTFCTFLSAPPRSATGQEHFSFIGFHSIDN